MHRPWSDAPARSAPPSLTGAERRRQRHPCTYRCFSYYGGANTGAVASETTELPSQYDRDPKHRRADEIAVALPLACEGPTVVARRTTPLPPRIRTRLVAVRVAPVSLLGRRRSAGIAAELRNRTA